MGALDIVILAIFAVFFIIGTIKGFTRQLFALILAVGTIAAVVFLSGPLANLLYSVMGSWVYGWFDNASQTTVMWVLIPIAAITIFLLTTIVANALRFALRKKKDSNAQQNNLPRPKMHPVNRILGGFFKCIWAFLLVSGLMSLLGLIAGTGLEGFIPVHEFIYESNGAISNFFFEGRWLERIWEFVMNMTAR